MKIKKKIKIQGRKILLFIFSQLILLFLLTSLLLLLLLLILHTSWLLSESVLDSTLFISVTLTTVFTLLFDVRPYLEIIKKFFFFL